MGKVQELHTLLDSGVSESDIPAAMRFASSETLRVGDEATRVSSFEVLEICRLLIRLSILSTSLKIGIVAGRVCGELLSKCALRFPELRSMYDSIGCTVLCILHVDAEKGSTLWETGYIRFPHLHSSSGDVGPINAG